MIVSSWLDLGETFLSRIPHRWCHVLIFASYQEAHNVELAHYWWCWDIWSTWYLLLIIKTLHWRFHSSDFLTLWFLLYSLVDIILQEKLWPFWHSFLCYYKKDFAFDVIIHSHPYSFWGAQIVFMLASMFCSHVLSDFSCLLVQWAVSGTPHTFLALICYLPFLPGVLVHLVRNGPLTCLNVRLQY